MDPVGHVGHVWEFITFQHIEERIDAVFRGRLARSGIYRLNEHEKWWREHAAALKESGFRLRPRFRPRWKPSWLGDERCQFAEDGITHPIPNVIDVRRIKDGKVVAIKRIESDSKEFEIARTLSPSEDRRIPWNHCVPVLDSFVDICDSDIRYIVMPLLRRFDDPEFNAVNEVVDFVTQALEGLAYMHSCGVVHGDCSETNILMDGTFLYPRGFHPSAQDKDVSGLNPATHLQRSDVDHVNYFYVDFSASSLCGNDRTADIDPNILFSADIFRLGQTFKVAFVEKYTNVDFIVLLIEDMLQDDYRRRPNATETLIRFRELADQIRSPAWRLTKIGETLGSTISHDLLHGVRQITAGPRTIFRQVP